MVAKKNISDKEKIILAIINNLEKCSTRQLLAMFEILGMAATAAFQLMQAAEVGQPLALKMEMIEIGESYGRSQTELKS